MQPQTPPLPSGYPPNIPPQPNYDFILSPQTPPKRFLPFMSGGTSLARKLATVVVGAVVLVILLVILKAVLSGTNPVNAPSIDAVIYDQEELIHLTASSGQNSAESAALSLNQQNFSVTANVTLYSAQKQLLHYLAINGQIITTVELNLAISRSIDTQLTSAVAADDYGSLYGQILNTQLQKYRTDLKTAYAQNTGKHGRALLTADYTGLQLLYTQLNGS